jgi:WS/DGAT/MGAT family acyltransferase
MKRLSSLDAAFWFAETHACPMHAGGLRICDPSEAPSFSFDAVRILWLLALRSCRRLRYRVVGARLGLDRPWLVEDPKLDIDFHVRRIAVPPPGGRRELDRLVGDLMSRPLDRTRPLWEKWFIEGVEAGRVATLTKIHHVLVDGVSGTTLVELMYDTSLAAATTWPPGQPAIGGAWRSTVRATRPGRSSTSSMTPYRVLRVIQQTLSQQLAVRWLANRPPHFFQAPTTRFNATIRAAASQQQQGVARSCKCCRTGLRGEAQRRGARTGFGALRRYVQDRGA